MHFITTEPYIQARERQDIKSVSIIIQQKTDFVKEKSEIPMGKNDIREEVATFISFTRNDGHSG